jgi:hypothetical protein
MRWRSADLAPANVNVSKSLEAYGKIRGSWLVQVHLDGQKE